MTLRRQFSLLTGLLILVLTVGSLAVTMVNSRDHFQQQLNARAFDAATSLAVALSNTDVDDTVAQERLIDVLFDRGFYEEIRLNLNSGTEIRRHAAHAFEDNAAPGWFRNVISLNLLPADADITSDWQRLGTVTVISHSDFAYRDLWLMVRSEILWFGWVLLISLLILQMLLKVLFHPLTRVERQAMAITERQWQVQEKIPRARELKRVVLAMNKMVVKLQAIFDEQAEATRRIREESMMDLISGLLNRRGFDQRLAHVIESGDEHSGVLLLIQVRDFSSFNQQEGREAGDDLLRAVGEILISWQDEYSGSICGRRTGADFSVFTPCTDRTQAEEMMSQLYALISTSVISSRGRHQFQIGAVCLQGKQSSLSRAFSCADAALRQAQHQAGSGCAMYQSDSGQKEWTAAEWRTLLSTVLKEKRIVLCFMPVLSSSDQRLIQLEVYSRIEWEGELISAARFWPMVEHHHFSAEYDLAIVESVLKHVGSEPGMDVRFCVNLSPASVIKESFHQKLLDLIRRYPQEAASIALEIPEFSLATTEQPMARLAMLLQPYGVLTGLDQLGTGSMAFAYLQRLPLDYVRIDGSFNRGVHRAQDHRFYIQSMVQIAHNLDLQILAEGLEQAEDVHTVRQTGVDGLGGYFFCQPFVTVREVISWSRSGPR